MEKYIIALLVLIAVAATVSVFIYIRKRKAFLITDLEKTDKKQQHSSPDSDLAPVDDQVLSLCFNELSILYEEDEMRLAEIKDKTLLAQINSVIPRAAQAAANAAAACKVNDYQDKMKSVGVLYQAIIPKGAVLSQSREMDSAVRGIYHGANGIKGHANLVAVNTDLGSNLAAVNVTNAAMGVASMVVGQYYMTQINDKLQSVNDKIDKLYKFQDNEFKSKVYALVAEIQKMAVFQYEIMASDEHRKRELAHLKNLEHQCVELLGQANHTIKDELERHGTGFSDYEDRVKEIDHWYWYRQMLVEILYRMSELTYVMNMGVVSREHSQELYLKYFKQSEDVQSQLDAWHTNSLSAYYIDLEQNKRKRHGVEGALMTVPAVFNHDLKYKAISESTASMIKKQRDANVGIKQSDNQDLFNEDVKLIAKDGKMYYLPPKKQSDEGE